MRKFRNVALAVATATTVAISGVSAASAANETEKPGITSSAETKQKIRDGLEIDNPEKEANTENIKSWLNPKTAAESNLPLWTKLLVGGGIAAAAASLLGLIASFLGR